METALSILPRDQQFHTLERLYCQSAEPARILQLDGIGHLKSKSTVLARMLTVSDDQLKALPNANRIIDLLIQWAQTGICLIDGQYSRDDQAISQALNTAPALWQTYYEASLNPNKPHWTEVVKLRDEIIAQTSRPRS